VSFPPGEARRLDLSEADRRGLAFRFDAPEPVAPPTAPRHPPAASSSAVTVPVSLVLTTAMPAGAVFVAWSGAPAVPALAGRAFVGHVPAEPIELRFQAPVGSGAFSVYLSSADARMGVAANSAPTTLAPGDTPHLVAVAPLRVPSQLQVSLDSGK
jgi:hypothetical protein